MLTANIRSSILLTCLSLCASVVQAQDVAKPQANELQVLFLGNSQIFYNDLPAMLEAVAASAPADRPRIRAARFVTGGASLERFWNAADTAARTKIAEKKWDFVILQDIYYTKRESFDKYATLFHDVIKKNGSRTVLFCTANISTLYPKGFHELHDMHVALGKKLQVPVAAAGKAWLYVWGDAPSAEQRLALYHADKAHPGVKGSYIYACTLYAAITGQSPVGLSAKLPKLPENTITPNEAKQFQEAAWRVHQEFNVKKAPLTKAERIDKTRNDLKSKDIELRRKAIHELVHSDLSKVLYDDMKAALSDTDDDVRTTAATALGNLGADATGAVPALIAQLQKDSNKLARETAARALGRIGKAAPNERQALLPLQQTSTKDADPVTRIVALGALAMMDIDIPGQVVALRKFLSNDDALARMKAAHALGMIGLPAKGTAGEIVMVLKRCTDPHLRGYVARALGNVGDPASLDALYEAYRKETDGGVRGEMRGAISRLGGKAPTP